MTEAALIAVDWGTTTRRIYVIDRDGDVVRFARDDRGVLAMAGTDYAAEIARIRIHFGALPMLCAGMIGSARGWREVPYVPCPATLADLAAATVWVDANTGIIPGVSFASGSCGDVMRGEEVQLLGCAATGLSPPDALLCQPGTHCKWAWMTNGAIARFATSMTGEVFALLRDHSLLSDHMTGEVVAGPAFAAGLAAADDGRLLSDLFGARAHVLLGNLARADVAAYVSGLLIGSDVREQWLMVGERVHVLAEPNLSELYTSAVANVGAMSVAVDSEAAFVAGITAIWSLCHAAVA